MRKIDPQVPWQLFDTETTRRIEQLAAQRLPAHTLMQRAGMATAKLALALAPHARRVWIAAGPGNNGGDGLEAAAHLHAYGKQVVVTWLGTPKTAPADAVASWRRAADAGVDFAAQPPDHYDLAVDALLGIGATRAPDGLMAQWISHMNSGGAPILAVDMPTGVSADTGHAGPTCVRASATLCLLTLKPGLFTAFGRDASAQTWLDELQVDLMADGLSGVAVPCAALMGAPAFQVPPHASHKGSFGDVAVVGGAPGMVGAALLAATAALHFGAGRVFMAPLEDAAMAVDWAQPELMVRHVGQLDMKHSAVVCGCGGGDAVRAVLPAILSTAGSLVLDADALNAIAVDNQLKTQLRARSARHWRTILTPHPLEAARLLGITTAEVQGDRLAAARRIAQQYGCTVVLKGSGTVIAATGQRPCINPTGNYLLASAGTGDVLAGAIGAALSNGLAEFAAACRAVYVHGLCADNWPGGTALTASALAAALRLPHSGQPQS